MSSSSQVIPHHERQKKSESSGHGGRSFGAQSTPQGDSAKSQRSCGRTKKRLSRDRDVRLKNWATKLLNFEAEGEAGMVRKRELRTESFAPQEDVSFKKTEAHL